MAIPSDPDQTQLFTEVGDVIGAGFNAGSYYNERVSELMRLANDASETNGCDPMARAEFYKEIQQIMQEEQPYLWLYAINGMYAAGPNVDSFDPRANAPLWQSINWEIFSVTTYLEWAARHTAVLPCFCFCDDLLIQKAER